MTKVKLVVGSESDLKRRIALVQSGSLMMHKMISNLGTSIKNSPPEFQIVSHLDPWCSELFNEDSLLLGQVWFCEKHGRLEQKSAVGVSWKPYQ